jgi:hypothetical protein
MGNSIYGICGHEGDNKKIEWTINGQKDSEPQKVRSAQIIQSNYRILKAKTQLQENQNEKLEEFDKNIEKFGRFITESEMAKKVDPAVRKTEMKLPPFYPTDEEQSRFKHVFKKPPILFQDDTIYHGQWNYAGKKHGFGVYIKKDGSKYEGFWMNDKINGRGRFIEKRENYYEGKNFLIFLIF